MKKKIATLKELRDQIQNLDSRDDNFDTRYEDISAEALSCLEGDDDLQEKEWIRKGQGIVASIKTDPLKGSADRDQALSYLKEAVDSVIIKEDL